MYYRAANGKSPNAPPAGRTRSRSELLTDNFFAAKRTRHMATEDRGSERYVIGVRGCKGGAGRGSGGVALANTLFLPIENITCEMSIARNKTALVVFCQDENNIDSSQPPIESILKEMKSLPTPLSVIAATPRKELENKFIFNPYTNKRHNAPGSRIRISESGLPTCKVSLPSCPRSGTAPLPTCVRSERISAIGAKVSKNALQ
ncbi:hypothetical protein EVAR_58931_1 [Eumeta japonica]|uniref:Uncharacterized protein n=1 Tax=Eumeta variegata TaxID=151549 RepID=A0A4C1YAC5_EUMVA|nr:hypothetical protein EVAR_58931_1 [Eumeta japonica]